MAGEGLAQIHRILRSATADRIIVPNDDYGLKQIINDFRTQLSAWEESS